MRRCQDGFDECNYCIDDPFTLCSGSVCTVGIFFPPGILAVTLRTVLSTVEGIFFFFLSKCYFSTWHFIQSMYSVNTIWWIKCNMWYLKLNWNDNYHFILVLVNTHCYNLKLFSFVYFFFIFFITVLLVVATQPFLLSSLTPNLLKTYTKCVISSLNL